jgi:hypothetical protein
VRRGKERRVDEMREGYEGRGEERAKSRKVVNEKKQRQKWRNIPLTSRSI